MQLKLEKIKVIMDNFTKEKPKDKTNNNPFNNKNNKKKEKIPKTTTLQLLRKVKGKRKLESEKEMPIEFYTKEIFMYSQLLLPKMP